MEYMQFDNIPLLRAALSAILADQGGGDFHGSKLI